jgi:hypothetical protein
MTFRTRLREIWGNPLHAVWIILAMLEIGVLVVCYDRFVLHNTSLWRLFRWAIPPLPVFFMQDIHRILWGSYIDAGGIRVGEAISAFSGKLVRGIWKPEHTLVVITMALSYIVGPSLFLWGLKARKARIQTKTAKPSAVFILLATAIGGYIVVFALMIPVLSCAGSWNTWQRMKTDSYVNAVRDGAVASVSVLGFQAEQLRLMPEAKGGGPWSGGPGGISIAELDRVLPSLERGLWAPGVKGSMKYILEVSSSDSLTLWGIADVQGTLSGSSFRNKDGTAGNVQVRAGVTPARVTEAVEN